MVVCLQIVFVCTYLKKYFVSLSPFFFVNAIDTESEKNRRKSIKIIYHSFFLLFFFFCFLLWSSSSSSDLSTHSRRMSKGQHNICRHFFSYSHSLTLLLFYSSRVNDLIYGLKLFTISCNLISTFNVLIIYLLYAPLFAEYCRKSLSHSFTHT